MGYIRTWILIPVLVFTFTFLFVVPHLAVWLSFPSEMRVLPDQDVDLEVGPLFSLVALPPAKADDPVRPPSGVAGATDSGYQLELRLFGWLPLQRTDVRVVERVEVVPGGQAVGILVSSRGLVVVRTVPVASVSGEHVSPAERAGIRPGDILIRIGDTTLEHPFELESIADAYGREGRAMPVTVLRGDEELEIRVTPELSANPSGRQPRYMIGLFLKDPAAGVGTMTFWHPESGAYGALGHMVAEGDSAAAISDGLIVPALIHGIHPGVRGRPGEKMGIFESGSSLGTIEKNTSFGIYGTLVRQPVTTHRPIPVALSHEVKEGEAEILTVLEGNKVERFTVQILSVNRQAHPTGRGMVIEVTDPRLLARTNGIVQGMSGSPIIQNGKLIGAVTHVFINNPARGFGVLAEWMVYEAGILEPRTPALVPLRPAS